MKLLLGISMIKTLTLTLASKLKWILYLLLLLHSLLQSKLYDHWIQQWTRKVYSIRSSKERLVGVVNGCGLMICMSYRCNCSFGVS